MFVFKCGEARGKGKTERKRKTVANRIIVLKKIFFFFLKEKANEKEKKERGKKRMCIFLLVLLFLFSSANLFHSMEMKSSSSKDKQPDCASGRPSMRKGNKPLKASPDSSGQSNNVQQRYPNA